MWGEAARDRRRRGSWRDGERRAPARRRRRADRARLHDTPSTFAGLERAVRAIVQHHDRTDRRVRHASSSRLTTPRSAGRFEDPSSRCGRSRARRRADGRRRAPAAVDVDGDRVAIGLQRSTCRDSWPAGIATLGRSAATCSDVALAGRYLACDAAIATVVVPRPRRPAPTSLRMTAQRLARAGSSTSWRCRRDGDRGASATAAANRHSVRVGARRARPARRCSTRPSAFDGLRAGGRPRAVRAPRG